MFSSPLCPSSFRPLSASSQTRDAIQDAYTVVVLHWVDYDMNLRGGCSTMKGALGRAGDSDNSCLSFPLTALALAPAFWLESLPGKGGAGSSRHPLV